MISHPPRCIAFLSSLLLASCATSSSGSYGGLYGVPNFESSHHEMVLPIGLGDNKPQQRLYTYPAGTLTRADQRLALDAGLYQSTWFNIYNSSQQTAGEGLRITMSSVRPESSTAYTVAPKEHILILYGQTSLCQTQTVLIDTQETSSGHHSTLSVLPDCGEFHVTQGNALNNGERTLYYQNHQFSSRPFPSVSSHNVTSKRVTTSRNTKKDAPVENYMETISHDATPYLGPSHIGTTGSSSTGL